MRRFRLFLAVWIAAGAVPLSTTVADESPDTPVETFVVRPIGRFQRTDEFTRIILDIRPFIPGYDTAEDAKVAEWLKKTGK